MVHSEVHLNKYVVSIGPSAVLYTCLHSTLTPIQKTTLFACFRFLIFSSIFQGASC